MTYIKVDTGFPEHWKTVELSDRAFRRLVTVWCMCSRAENNGRLTDAQVSKLFSQKVRDELVAVHYLDKCESGWQMHDYLDHQTSAEHIADLRRKRAEAGSKGGRAKAEHLASAKQSVKQTASKNVPEVEVEEEIEQKTTTELPSSAKPMARSRYPSEFLAFWKEYPRKVGKDKALGAWKSAIKRSDQATVMAGLRRMLADPNLPDEGFIPHPTTWLNRGGWDDAPFPPRNPTQTPKQSTSEVRAAQAWNLVEQIRAEEEAEYLSNVLEIGPAS